MAISILKEPSGIYPAYNDSFVEFQSSLIGDKRAEVTVFPTSVFTRTFVLYPDSQGRYLFNLKEIVKVQLNQGGFDDVNYFTDSYFKSISGQYLLQAISIEVFNDSESEVLSKTYEFYKSVKQVGEKLFSNPFQVLSDSKNGVDFYLTYFEGFPFHFDIQRIIFSESKKIKFKNKRTGIESIEMTPDFTGAFRVNIDRSDGDNWTNGNVLPLIVGLNQLEVVEDGEFRSNVYLKKKKACKGVYLKWFNSDGGFSHYLFDEYFTEKIKGRDVDLISSNDFQNLSSLNSGVKSIGKTGRRTIKVKARCDENESNVLRSLYTSPSIQMYSSKEANVKGDFFNVQVEDTFEFKNKKGFNEFVLTVELPELITARL